jgi:transcriptional regulator with XRE-family HTH domain
MALFGANLRTVREHRDISQAGLAELMTAKGHAWGQQTVYKTEHGERTVRFHEAIDLAEVLGVTTDRFTRLPEEAADEFAVDQAAALLEREWDRAAGAIAGLLQAGAAAEGIAARFGGSKHARVRAAVRGLLADVADRTAETAAGEGAARWARTRGGA